MSSESKRTFLRTFSIPFGFEQSEDGAICRVTTLKYGTGPTTGYSAYEETYFFRKFPLRPNLKISEVSYYRGIPITGGRPFPITYKDRPEI